MTLDKAFNQLQRQKEAWDGRAAGWEDVRKNQESYVNFEDGYKKFLDLLDSEILGQKFENGIDIGCGDGETAEALSKNVKNLYLVDLSSEMLKIAHKRVPEAALINKSATDTGLTDNIADIIISRGVVVSHLPKEIIDEFFREISRLANAGCKIIVDYLSNMDSAGFSNTFPKISFTKEEMQTILESFGFENIKFDGDDSSRVVRVVATKK